MLWSGWGWAAVVSACAGMALVAAAVAARFCRDTWPASRVPLDGPV